MNKDDEIIELLSNVTAALESCLAHYERYMTSEDVKNRNRLINESKRVLCQLNKAPQEVSMSTYEIQTTTKNQNDVIRKLQHLGTVTNKWLDGSINFQCHDAESEDKVTDILDHLDINYRLV